jgi:PIN domain nuclease of toxin-antitoxin system
LDTHVWIWFVEGERRRLSPRVVSLLTRASRSGRVYVSAISAWEIARLVAKGRMRLGTDVSTWVGRAFAESGALMAGFTLAIAVEAGTLAGSVGGAPEDWIIVATARSMDATLVTRDAAILAYGAAGHVRVVDAGAQKPSFPRHPPP